MRAIVFSGGGSRGAYELGVYGVLHERGLRPQIVAGTSIGAILATLVAAGMRPSQMEQQWFEICKRPLFPRRRDVWRIHHWPSLRRNEALGPLLERLVEWEAVRSSKIVLRVTAVDANTGDRLVFGNQDVTAEHLRGSASMPGVFPPVTVARRPIWDGGLIARTPIRAAIEAGADEIYAVLTQASPHVGKTPKTFFEAIDRMVEIMMDRSLRHDLRRVQEINELVSIGVGGTRWRHVELHVIGPTRPLGVSLLSFDVDQAKRLIRRGRADALRYFSAGFARPTIAD